MTFLQIQIHQSNAEFYVATLALGLLNAMKSGAIPFETGIWSLARPQFLDETLPFCSPELQMILQQFDELDALSTLVSSEQAMQQMDDWIEILQNIMAKHIPNIDCQIIAQRFQAA
ncbi:hypothetical protein [Wielerella bovis]|uniref:hypothetical protein n=1 Tax=Wielerella bovis TaxID=2917790 RepID=UPI0020195018|nr:hypothetical protein [Wielerella bovis]ULJ62880.1 hypothetical protein MIS46_02060 [Wielerella bovis]ULJ65110.1 hypothetical protein MIS33_02105 [Wielerella bovis]ULJ67384.1 hypothetical protein MIS31_02115 [Wielerella bovis]